MCGAYFESRLNRWMEKTEINEVHLSNIEWFNDKNIYKLEVSSETFQVLLNEVKTGECDLEEDVYKILCDYFQYSKWRSYPEGAFGPKEYEYYYGVKIEDVPPVPTELLKVYNGPCPFNERKPASQTHMLYLVPGDWDLNTVAEKAKNPQQGHATEQGFRYFHSKIKEKYGEEKPGKSYWILKTKENLPSSYSLKSYYEYMEKAKEYGYEAPSLLEEAIGEVVWYVVKEEMLMSTHETEGYDIYTVCRDKPVNKGMYCIIGGFGPTGPNVDISLYGHYYIGVAGVVRRKF